MQLQLESHEIYSMTLPIRSLMSVSLRAKPNFRVNVADLGLHGIVYLDTLGSLDQCLELF